jgi:hypothetical protein
MPPHHHDHRPIALAVACVVLGLAALAAALIVLSSGSSPSAAAPPVPIATAAPTPTVTAPAAASQGAPAGSSRGAASAAAGGENPLATARSAWERLFARNEVAHVPAQWVSGFYGLYDRAQRTFGVNWLLLASIHRQETAFSTASSTYRGLNFARCCAGPMQFNVTNGPTTTWERFRAAYRQAARPRDYPHRTGRHPSVYDDYDAIMAAASLLRASGAAAGLDVAAWRAAYDYYGHDDVGVEYADQVLARAIGWSQHGFSINQPVDAALLAAVHAAWGAPVADALAAERRAAAKAAAGKHRG